MTDVDSAAPLGERIRDVVSAEPIAVESQAISVTVSVGMSGGDDTEAMLRAADTALYAAKAAGRDRVVTA